MKKIIVTLCLITSATAYAGYYLLDKVAPESNPTAVIGEKPSKQRGGQAVILLPKNMSRTQSQMLNLAYELGKQDGHRQPEIVQAILLQETKAGGMKSYKVANPGADAYFGPMQIKLSAAKDVLQKYPSLWTKYEFHTKTDDEVKANLILNEKFNIDVGSKYLMILSKQYGFSGRTLMNAYNRGPGGVRNVDESYHYALGAESKLAAFKRSR